MALLAPWLADFQLLAAALLLGVMLAIALLRQPAQRLAVAKSTLVALAALALLCAIPGWSLVHLLNSPPAPAPIASPASLADIPAFAPTPAPLPFEPVAAAPSSIVTTIETPPTPPPAEPIDWPAAIVPFYAAGCALVALWLAIGGLLARRVLSQATPAPPELEQLLAQITGPVARPPRLLMSNHIAAPVALGLRRPAILLPLPRREGQGEGFPTHPLESEPQLLPILAHEWAHLEHRDLHTLAATRLLLILLWPQPLFWLLRRTIRLDQETLADAAAADRAGRLDYAQQLLAWARTASTQRPPRLAGAVGLWEGPSQLKRRIAVLLNEKFSVIRSCSPAWRRLCIASLGVAAVALSLVTLQPTPVAGGDDSAISAAGDDELSPQASPHSPAIHTSPDERPKVTISGRIAADDASSQPAVKQLHYVSFQPGSGYSGVVDLKSDRFSVDVPVGTVWLAYLPKDATPAWVGPLTVGDQPIDDVVLRPSPGFSVPVEVVDGDGKPIAGATLSLSIILNGVGLSGPQATTDEQGAVELDRLADLPYAVTVTAPSFAPRRVAAKDFKPNEPVRFTLTPTQPTTGVIANADGSPAGGAVLRRWEENYAGGSRSEHGVVVTADAQGRFTLDQLSPGSTYVYLVETRENARTLSPEISAGMNNVLIRVPARRSLQGRLVGDVAALPRRDGRPYVSVRQQLNYHFVEDNFSVSRPFGNDVFVTPTAEGGEFTYEGLLPGEVEISAGDVSKTTAVNEGGVTDVVIQVSPKADDVSKSAAADAEDELAKRKELAERGSAFAKQLTLAPNLFMGFCIDEAGKPLPGVDVSLYVHTAFAKENVEPIARVQTGADGRFEFNQPVDVAKEFPGGVPADGFVKSPVKFITAVAKAPGRATKFQNDALYRFVKHGQAAILRMTPSSTLTGRVTNENGVPLANAIVSTNDNSAYIPNESLRTRTDAAGRFAIDDVASFDADAAAREHLKARERSEHPGIYPVPQVLLSVEHSGFANKLVRVKNIPGDLEIALSPGVTITGRVVAQGADANEPPRPVANAHVVITRTRQPKLSADPVFAHREEQRGVTDAAGNYSFTSLPASEYAVSATAPNLTTLGVRGVGAAAGQTVTAPDVVLRPGAIVRVKLVDGKTNAPLKLKAGQKGYIHPRRNPSAFYAPDAPSGPETVEPPLIDSPIVAFTADAIGETRLPPGKYSLFVSIPEEDSNYSSVSADGHANEEEFEVREGETIERTVPMLLTLAASLRATATVQPSNQPADGDDSAKREENATQGESGAMDFRPTIIPADSNDEGASLPANVIEIDGQQVILGDPVPEAELRERGIDPTVEPSEGSTQVAPPKTTHKTLGMATIEAVPIEPAKHQPNALELHIVDENNQPLAGVEATLYSASSSSGEPKPFKTLVTDDAGNAIFADVVPADQIAKFAAMKAAGEFIYGSQGAYHIALKHPGRATALLYQSAGDLALAGVKRTIMLRPAVKLSGRVTDPAGEPVADAVVTAGGFSGNLSIAGVNAVATDAAGQFEFNDRGPFNRAAANEANQFMGYVTTAHSPAAQADSTAAEDPTAKNVSDLVVTHPKFAVTRIEGGDVPGVADVQLLPATSIVGRVINHQSGAPAAGVTVQALGDPTGPPQLEKEDNVLAYRVPYSHSASVRTDARGNYRLDNLPAGTYNLWVDSESTPGKPFKHASQGASAVVTQAGAESTQAPDIIVGPPATVTVQLIDAETGEPWQLDGNAVAVPMAVRGSDYRQQQNPHQRVPISKDGTFTFSSLPGRFRIGVEVVDKPGSNYQAIYRSSDDFDRSAAVTDLGFGENVSTELAVRPMAQLQQFRAEHGKAFSLLQAKKFDEAIAVFNEMVAARPNDYEPISGRCFAYRTAGRYAEAIADAEVMLKHFPEDSQGKFVLADLLATSPIAETRDGKRALKYAEELVATTKASRLDATTMAQCLGFKAAAYAELGEFAKAVAAQQQALDLVPSSQDESVHKTLAERLELYRANKPFHRAATPVTPSKPSTDQGASKTSDPRTPFWTVSPSTDVKLTITGVPAAEADRHATDARTTDDKTGWLLPEPALKVSNPATLQESVK